MFGVRKACRELSKWWNNLLLENNKLKVENAMLRDLAVLNWEWAHSCCNNNCKMHTDDCGYGIDRECNYEREIYDRMQELKIKANK